MKSSSFQDAVESSTKVIGRKTSVSVVFEGDRAETDGDTVYIPALPPSAEINMEQADIIRGYRDHESMHIRCTDTSADAMAELAKIQQEDNHLFSIVQYCEDTRIENAGIQEYSGMRNSLTATNVRVAQLLHKEMSEYGDPKDVFKMLKPDVQFNMATSSIARNIIGVENGGVLDEVIAQLKTTNPEMYALAEKSAKLMTKLPTGVVRGVLNEKQSKKHTADSFALARQIHTEYVQLVQQQQQQQQQQDEKPGDQGQGDGGNGQGQGDDQGQGQQGQGDAQGQGQGGGQQDASNGDGQGDGSQSQGQGQQGSGGDQGGNQGGDGQQGGGHGQGQGQGGGQSQGDGGNQGDNQQGGSSGGSGHGSGQSGGGNGSGTHQVISDEQQRKLNDMMQNAAKSALGDVVNQVSNEKDLNHKTKPRRYLRASNKFSVVVPAFEGTILCHQGVVNSEFTERYEKIAKERFDQIDKSVTGKRAMIRRLLELELQARSDRRWNSGFSTGRLPAVRVVDAIAGREGIYQQRSEGKDMNTLLYISIDGSASMTEGRTYDRATGKEGPSRMEASLALAYALSEALERTGCDIIVRAWGNRAITKKMHKNSGYTHADLENLAASIGCSTDRTGRMYGVHGAKAARFASLGLLTRTEIKQKRQRTTDPSVRRAFGVSSVALNCSTPTFDAVFADIDDLAKEPHAKKIYLHITDGAPDAIRSSQFTKESLMKEAHDYAASVGVHMIGVGIAGRKVGELFSDNVEVEGADSYEPVIKKLAKLVAKESGHAATFKRAA